MNKYLHAYRFELLFAVLVMVIFDKILVVDDAIYNGVVWPINMVLLGIVSLGVFEEHKVWEKIIRNVLFAVVIAVPLGVQYFFRSEALTLLAFISYMLFYGFLFYSVMFQISRRPEVTPSVIFGSLSGFLLLSVVACFSYMVLDVTMAQSFNNMIGSTTPEKYQQFTYFSLVTLTTIGYGDITPATDQARLLAGFWGVMSQFYMVGIVGIIISKYTSK